MAPLNIPQCWSWVEGAASPCSSIVVVKCICIYRRAGQYCVLQAGKAMTRLLSFSLEEKLMWITRLWWGFSWHGQVGNIIIADYTYIYIYIYTSTSLFRMVQLRWWLHLDKDTSILWASLWIMVHMSIYKIRYPQKSSKWFMHACTYNGAVIQWFYFIMQKGGSALMIACSEGHTAIVQLLLKNDANTNLQALVWILFGIHNVLFTWPVSSLIFVLGIAHTFCVLTAWRNCFGVCH